MNNQTMVRNCPNCGNEGIVYESLTTVEGDIKRKRKCKFCGHRWVTLEKYLRDVQKMP